MTQFQHLLFPIRFGRFRGSCPPRRVNKLSRPPESESTMSDPKIFITSKIVLTFM